MSLDQLVIVTFKNKRRYVYVETRSKRGVFKLYNPGYKCARSMHAGLLLSKTCTERAEGCMGQNKFVNMFLFLKYLYGIFKPILELIWELFWKNIFYFVRRFWNMSGLVLFHKSFLDFYKTRLKKSTKLVEK